MEEDKATSVSFIVRRPLFRAISTEYLATSRPRSPNKSFSALIAPLDTRKAPASRINFSTFAEAKACHLDLLDLRRIDFAAAGASDPFLPFFI